MGHACARDRPRLSYPLPRVPINEQMPPPPTEVFASRLFLGPALRAQPDRRLVTLVREGYETAFEEIVRRYARPLTRYAAAIVGSRSEDVTQDAFSKALSALRRDESEIELRPWLYRIVRNTALNDLRDRPPTTEILEEALAAGRGTAAEAEEREELQELIERLRALPERQRAAIVMREFEGLSHEEIAAALGLSGGAARQVIFRAREALRSGAGMVLPLPLMRLLLEHGTEATTAGAGGAAGALAAGGAAGGASAALKAGAVALILAGSVGTGVAIQDDHGQGSSADAATLSSEKGSGNEFGSQAQPPSGSDDSGTTTEVGDEDGGDRNRGRGHDEDGGNGASGRSGPGDSSGPGGGREVAETGHRGNDSGGSGPGGGGGSSGPGGGDDRSGIEDRHGDSNSGSASGSGESGGGGGTDDSSGPGGGGDSGSGVSGGGDSSGPGGGGDDGTPAPSELEPVIEGIDGGGGSSGSEGSSGSGSSVSGSSGRDGGDAPAA